ncbi:hypothetical protein ElyMa_003843300 [Elysia marginata]|uniref:Uncharacterized protein n=1 Tax=Elysia marginata TaxID=1093978 RepID=A0AAV4FGP5_9GAST|nr:hypothetical protein ElyMa_003843300 [Elysia marginata]
MGVFHDSCRKNPKSPLGSGLKRHSIQRARRDDGSHADMLQLQSAENREVLGRLPTNKPCFVFIICNGANVCASDGMSLCLPVYLVKDRWQNKHYRSQT